MPGAGPRPFHSSAGEPAGVPERGGLAVVGQRARFFADPGSQWLWRLEWNGDLIAGGCVALRRNGRDWM